MSKSSSKMAEKNPMWKGDKVSYTQLHSWLKARMLKPPLCEVCNERPIRDLANITGTYNRDFSNWKWMCRKCHMESDGRMENFVNSKRTTGLYKLKDGERWLLHKLYGFRNRRGNDSENPNYRECFSISNIAKMFNISDGSVWRINKYYQGEMENGECNHCGSREVGRGREEEV